jgi:MarR-like DNA-binding transcriptional regulator SgrR of sgrS sRNA
MSGQVTAEARLLEALRRRLRDTSGRPVRLTLAKLAGDENLSSRQARRALRHLAQLGLLDLTDRGGEVIVARRVAA